MPNNMDFSPKTKSWMILICIVLATGGTVTMSTFLGGSKIGFSIFAGLVAGATNVYHALNSSPNDPPDNKNKTT